MKKILLDLSPIQSREQLHDYLARTMEIGRASCRERV